MIKAKHKYYFFLLIIIISSLFCKLHYIERYSTFTDEILSAVVSQSIAQNGIPMLPSNTIYPRAPLHHYLSAIPIGLLGINYFSMRINSILFSLLTILIIYLLGIRVANQKVAIAAALLLALNAFFNQYSLAGRMYMTYACFYILSLYFFYRGFIEGKTLSKTFSILFMIASMLSSEAGLIIGPIFVFLIYFYYGKNWYKDKAIILGGVAWIVIAYLILFYKMPGVFDPFTAQSGQPPSKLLSFDLPIKTIISSVSYIWRILDRSIPLSVPFFIVMTILVIKKKQLKEHFPLIALLPALIIQSTLFNTIIQKRVMVTIFPLYILTCCQLFLTLWNWATVGIEKEGSLKRFIVTRAKEITIAVTVFGLISVPFIIDKFLIKPTEFPISFFKPFHDQGSESNPEPAYLYVKKHVKRADIVLQTTLEYGLFFLGDEYNHYYLRQKKYFDTNGSLKYISFPKKNEPYYGRPIIDSVESLKKLMANSPTKIWLILGVKSKWSMGLEIKEFIKGNFQLKFSDNGFKVYYFRFRN